MTTIPITENHAHFIKKTRSGKYVVMRWSPDRRGWKAIRHSRYSYEGARFASQLYDHVEPADPETIHRLTEAVNKLKHKLKDPRFKMDISGGKKDPRRRHPDEHDLKTDGA